MQRAQESQERQVHSEKVHLIREFVQDGEIVVEQIASANNLADPFTKTLTEKVFSSHVESMGVRLGRSDL